MNQYRCAPAANKLTSQRPLFVIFGAYITSTATKSADGSDGDRRECETKQPVKCDTMCAVGYYTNRHIALLNKLSGYQCQDARNKRKHQKEENKLVEMS